ncbi:uncharacterized protein LOC126085937 [Elephas maximus indicus]|uniref:uncharacterized protein LOC126085937 n=1 Tax=Elephas maximus indicus TaxID=99487 RepID=UPI0021168AA0|nr:uncharacterized protein LOC126085937 [Elephas maximus indicus]
MTSFGFPGSKKPEWCARPAQPGPLGGSLRGAALPVPLRLPKGAHGGDPVQPKAERKASSHLESTSGPDPRLGVSVRESLPFPGTPLKGLGRKPPARPASPLRTFPHRPRAKGRRRRPGLCLRAGLPLPACAGCEERWGTGKERRSPESLGAFLSCTSRRLFPTLRHNVLRRKKVAQGQRKGCPPVPVQRLSPSASSESRLRLTGGNGLPEAGRGRQTPGFSRRGGGGTSKFPPAARRAPVTARAANPHRHAPARLRGRWLAAAGVWAVPASSPARLAPPEPGAGLHSCWRNLGVQHQQSHGRACPRHLPA